jgi:hypothetical protein
MCWTSPSCASVGFGGGGAVLIELEGCSCEEQPTMAYFSRLVEHSVNFVHVDRHSVAVAVAIELNYPSNA